MIAGSVLGAVGGRNWTEQLDTFGDNGVGTRLHVLPALKTPPLALVKVTVPVGLLAPEGAASATVAVQVSEAVAMIRLQITCVTVGWIVMHTPPALRTCPAGHGGRAVVARVSISVVTLLASSLLPPGRAWPPVRPAQYSQ